MYTSLHSSTRWRGSLAIASLLLLSFAGIAVIAASSGSAQAGPATIRPHVAHSEPDNGAWQMITPVTSLDLRDVDMVSSADGWAVGGELGTAALLLRYNGTSWVTATIPATDVLVDVHMLDANNGYILGWNAQTTGDIYHWDGASWTHVFTATRALNRIHASAPNNVWAVGLNLTVHWDGAQWTEILPPVERQIFAVHVPSDGTAWAFGQYVPQTDHGLVMSNTTGTWNLVPNPAPQSLFDGFFSSPTDGWAAGGVDPTYVLHYDGVSWTWAYTNTYGIQRFYMFSPTSGWAIGNPAGKPFILRFNGVDFVPVPHSSIEQLNGIDMVSETEGWIVGTAGTMLRYYKPAVTTPTVTPTVTRTRTATPTRTVTPCSMSFSDVQPTDYFYEPVRYLYCMGAISGYGDGTFRPFNTTTRSQLTKILELAEGWPLLDPKVPTFNDVPTSHPFFQFVETAFDREVISGYACGAPGEPCPGSYFRPYNNVTRGQLCKIIVLAEGWPINVAGGPHFNDVPPTNPFYDVIETAFNKGIISGYACGGPGEPCPGAYFRWGNNATRGQIAKIVYNAVTAP